MTTAAATARQTSRSCRETPAESFGRWCSRGSAARGRGRERDDVAAQGQLVLVLGGPDGLDRNRLALRDELREAVVEHGEAAGEGEPVDLERQPVGVE